MSLFFSFLPIDLQKDILCVWLNVKDSGRGLLRAFSALDVACSAAERDRDALLFLISQVPPFGEYVPVDKYAPASTVASKNSYMQWLYSRNVAVQSLLLQDSFDSSVANQTDIPFVLPFVETIFWHHGHDCSSEVLAIVLRACPNVTALRCTTQMHLSGAVAACAPNLKILAVDSFHMEYAYDDDDKVTSRDSLAFLRTIGPRLEVLSARCSVLDAGLERALSGHCRSLQSLEVYRAHDNTSIVPILKANKHLKIIGLYGGTLFENEVEELLTMKQVKCLTAHQTDEHNALDNCDIFEDMLELRPDIEFLAINDCTFAAADGGILRIRGDTIQFYEGDLIFPILEVCPSLTELDITEVNADDDVLQLIGERFGTQLRSLSLWISSTQCSMRTLLDICGPSSLKSLALTGRGVSGELQQCIAESCTRLESLTFVDTVMVSGSTMKDICRGCPNMTALKMASVNICLETLQAIVDSKQHWKSLDFACHGDFQKGVDDWFRKQVMKLPLWPKPAIHMTLTTPSAV